jgi:hypothetical protein
MNVLTRHKGSLAKINNTTQYFAKPTSQNFGDDFEDSSATRDRP